MTAQDLRELFENELASSGLSPKDFARKHDLHYETLRRHLDGRHLGRLAEQLSFLERLGWELRRVRSVARAVDDRLP